MEFTFSEDQQRFRENIARFFHDRSPTTEVRRLMSDPAGYDPTIWSQMSGQLGLCGIAIPEEYGGAGFGAQELAIACEEMGRALYCGPFLASAVCAAYAIATTADETFKQQWLPQLASGNVIACVAVTEHAPLWCDDDIKTNAIIDGSGQHRLTGEKRYVVDAQVAQLIVVAAQQANASIALYAVHADAPGLTCTPMASMDPTRKLNSLQLSDTPAIHLGTADLQDLMDYTLVALANEMMGGAQTLLQSALDYTQLRVQFGRSIASFQAIKHRLAELLLEVELAKSAAYQAAYSMAVGKDCREHASLAKAAAAEAYLLAATECIQLHGGIGFTWENDTHLWFKRAKSSEVLLGAPALHRERMLQAMTTGAGAKTRIG